MDIKEMQRRLGVPVDGIVGPSTLAAIERLLNTAAPATLAWGAKVSPAFRAKVRGIAERLGCKADDLMGCMAWESGETFSPAVKNMAGSGAVGLIQFMPATAKALGTSTGALAAMTAEEQLDWVERYFQPSKGRLGTLADLYMAILWPAAVGKPMNAPLWGKDSRPTTYRQNAGLDANRDGVITKAECAGKFSSGLRHRQLGKIISFKCRGYSVGKLVRAGEALGLKAVSVQSIAIFNLTPDARGIGFELFGEPAVERDVEQLPQYLEPVLAVRHEESLEPALRQQDDLAELLRAIAEKTLDMAEYSTDFPFCQGSPAAVRTDVIDRHFRYIEQPGSMWLHRVSKAGLNRVSL